MGLLDDLLRFPAVQRARRDGRGPFTAPMLRAFEAGRCQQCDARVPRNSFANALHVQPGEVQYLCRHCRGLHLPGPIHHEHLNVIHYRPDVAVAILVTGRWQDLTFSDAGALTLLRLGSPIFSDREFRSTFNPEDPHQHVQRLLSQPPGGTCGECRASSPGAQCPHCGAPHEQQWYGRLTAEQERDWLSGRSPGRLS